MVESIGRPLNGMDQIAKYTNRGESTILKWVSGEGFPARKVGGVWISHTIEIDRWYIERVQSRPAVDVEKLTEVILARSRLGKDAAARLAAEIIGEIT